MPQEIAQLSLLNTLNIRNNKLETLPSLKTGLPLLTSFNVSYNNLKFSAIAASGFIGGNSGFTFSPQNILASPTLVRENNKVSLMVSNPHANDVYKWFRTNTEITGQSSNVYSYESLSPAVYYATFTNSLYPGLTLRTSTVNDEPDVVLIVNNPPHACEPATVNLTSPQVTEGSSANLSFSYWIDEEASIALSNPSSVSASDTYYIKATSSLGGTTIKPVVVQISANPELYVIQPDEICEPNTIDLTLLIDAGTSSGLTFTYWSDYQSVIPVENYKAVDLPGTYYIKGTSSEGCSATKPVLVSITPKPALGLTLDVSPSSTVCSGEEVLFSANALNGGDKPRYIWYLNNNVLSGENQESFVSRLLQNGDTIKVGVVSSAICAGNDTVYSEPITMNISNLDSVLITIEAEPAGLVCANIPIVFTATPSLSSETDQCYWLKNGTAIPGAIGLNYTANNLENGDSISVRYHSGLSCVNKKIIESTTIEIQSIPLKEVQVTLTASDTIICEGEEVTFTAIPYNGGYNPKYRWFNNGEVIPNQTDSVYTSQLTEGKNISVELTSDESCVSNQTANSGVLSVTVNPQLTIIGYSTTPTSMYGTADGSITINGISGGSGGNIALLLDGKLISDNLTLPFTYSSLAAGAHTVELSEAAGCNSEPVGFNITQPSSFTFTATVTQHETAVDAADGIILIDSIEAAQTLSFEYTINNRETWKTIAQGDSITGLTAGTYTITLRTDSVESQPIEIEVKQTCSSYSISINYLTECGNTQGAISVNGLDPDKYYEYKLIPKNLPGKPVITLVGENPLTWPLGQPFVDPGATALDEKDGDITSDIVVVSNLNVNTLGNYQITYNVTDTDGNAAEEVVRSVIVEEGIDWNYEGVMTTGLCEDEYRLIFGYSRRHWGVLNPNEPLIVELSHELSQDYIRILIDGITELTSVFINSEQIHNKIFTPVYDNEALEWRIYGDDVKSFPKDGETCDIKLKYTLVDEPVHAVPILILENETEIINIALGSSWEDYQSQDGNIYYASTYNKDDARNDVVVSSNVNSNIVGQYNIIYSLTDDLGHYIEKIRIVNVFEITYWNYEGILTAGQGPNGLIGYFNKIGGSFWDCGTLIPRVNISDIESFRVGTNNLLMADFQNNDDISVTNMGIYLSVDDAIYSLFYHESTEGYFIHLPSNLFEVGSNYNIKWFFDEPILHTPTITLIGDSTIIINRGSVYTDPGCTAYDTRYGDISSSVAISDNIDANTPGIYTVRYNVTTEDGYSAVEVVRTVIVGQSPPQFEEVTIGTQTWMSKNLDIDDGGDGIYVYGGNENNPDYDYNLAAYGRLYTWEAAMRVAATVEGWHLPSNDEWNVLSNYLGGNSVSGGKLKEAGITHWKTPNTGATNSSGFTAIPGGFGYKNSYSNIQNATDIWTSTSKSSSIADKRSLYYLSPNLILDAFGSEKLNCFSVRLIKNK